MGNKNNKGQKDDKNDRKMDGTANEADGQTDDLDVMGNEQVLMTEQQFNAAFKHRGNRDQEAFSPGKQQPLVINPKLQEDHKYEIFRNVNIKKMLEEHHIVIVGIIKFGKAINVYKAKRDDKLLIVKMINMNDIDKDKKKDILNDIEMRKIINKGSINMITMFQYENCYFLVLDYGKFQNESYN